MAFAHTPSTFAHGHVGTSLGGRIAEECSALAHLCSDVIHGRLESAPVEMKFIELAYMTEEAHGDLPHLPDKLIRQGR